MEAAENIEDYELADQLAHVIQSLQNEAISLEQEKSQITNSTFTNNNNNSNGNHHHHNLLTDAFTQVYLQLQNLQTNPQK